MEKIDKYMYAHDKKVLLIIYSYLTIVLIIGLTKLYFLKFHNIIYTETIIFRICFKLYFYLSCIVIGYLYKDFLIADFNKSEKKKKFIWFSIFFSLATMFILKQLFVYNKKETINRNENIFLVLVESILTLYDVIIFSPFFEEIVFRRFGYQMVKGGMNLIKSIKSRNYTQLLIHLLIICVNSLSFGLSHYSKMYTSFFTWPLIYYTIGGLSLCLCCEFTDTIAGPIRSHMFFNTVVIIIQIFSNCFAKKLSCSFD